MKKILLILAILVPMLASAQRMEIYVYDNYKYLSLFAYGLPREVVKTNDEMRASMTNGDGTGVMRRHHTSKGYDQPVTADGFNNNLKMSFAFLIAPHNVDRAGNEVIPNGSNGWMMNMSWADASGRTADRTGVNPSPTGCAAYTGPSKNDKPGSWRLPTQRELQVMFTMIEQAYGHLDSGEVEGSIANGNYWSSTEFDGGFDEIEGDLDYIDSADHVWAVYNFTGQTFHTTDSDECFARCVKDIYEPINE